MSRVSIGHVLLILLVVILCLAGITPGFKSNGSCRGDASLNSRIKLEVASSTKEREKGLSGRRQLPPGCGLIFKFDQSGYYGFWMKDMYFAIDIVWIDENFKIVSISEALQPNTFPTTFYPPLPVRYAVELNSGEAEKAGLREGDLARVTFY